MQFTFGGLTFNVDIDDTGSVAWVLNQKISLQDTNVVLVDNVDSKPMIVRVERVDPVVPVTCLPFFGPVET
jgi:hypothetical protein